MWYWECYTPHPPIIIPDVGRGREAEASATIGGMRSLSRLTAINRADTILILSPHAPFFGGLSMSLARDYYGDFGMFGAPGASLSMPGALQAGEALASHLEKKFYVVKRRHEKCPLDHGSLIPLSFIAGGGSSHVPSLVLANPIGLSPSDAFALGRALSEAPADGSWALIASGDLSHRVTRDAPAGYSPFGAEFDRMIVEAFKSNDPSRLLSLQPDEIDRAGECGLRSALVFLGLAEGRSIRSISYEAPFGVGYATAFAPLHSATLLARAVLEECVRKGRRAALEASSRFSAFPELKSRSACFVTLKTGGGEQLRGCIGTILPARDTLLEEITENAQSAALRDPRFPPVAKEELGDISLSVDLLSLPEPVSSLDSLDPAKFGVIVERNGLRGVLLPALEGVDSVDQQIAIAARKAGIHSAEGASISRFTVNRIREEHE